MMFIFFAVNVAAEQVVGASQQTGAGSDQSEDYAEEMAEATEEVNTNDPTAAAISVSAGWEFYSWHEDEIAPGQTRPVGSDHNFNTRFVIALAKGMLGSPWPIINRFSFSNVERVGGTSISETLTPNTGPMWSTRTGRVPQPVALSAYPRLIRSAGNKRRRGRKPVGFPSQRRVKPHRRLENKRECLVDRVI